jgi:hypothetical protein
MRPQMRPLPAALCVALLLLASVSAAASADGTAILGAAHVDRATDERARPARGEAQEYTGMEAVRARHAAPRRSPAEALLALARSPRRTVSHMR